jgi:energy-converting hydrogenase A subunit P
MARNSFVQGSGIFAYSGTNCLRNEYYHNDCRRCIEICPKGAFHIVRNKLTLFENECIACAACIGGCPTEALTLETFDPNAFTVAFKDLEDTTLSCKRTTPCLGVFDTQHLITMALRGETAPICDMAHCEGCALNETGDVETRIRGNVATANAFFESVGLETRIETVEEKPEEANERRALFRKAFDTAKAQVGDGAPHDTALTLEHQRSGQQKVPLKSLLLKNSIREKIGTFAATAFEGRSPLFFDKAISFDACTNCGDCVQFCPTEALQATGDKHGINFTSGNCIGCGICDDICKTDAIATAEGYDLVEVVYDRVKTLVHYEMVQCHECRCPYPYKGGDPICDRCKDFKSDFSDMFTLAKDL